MVVFLTIFPDFTPFCGVLGFWAELALATFLGLAGVVATLTAAAGGCWAVLEADGRGSTTASMTGSGSSCIGETEAAALAGM
jgi:hypothetical protein